MTANFKRGTVQYSLQITSPSLRECEEKAASIGPDPSIWTPHSWRKNGLNLLNAREHKNLSATAHKWSNQYSKGQVQCFDDPEKVTKVPSRRGDLGHYPVPEAIEFTDRPEFR